jgi:hypothetical protein
MADYIERIAGEWHQRSDELADWVLSHLVNRSDVWGRYARARGEAGESQIRVVTAPFREERGKVFLGVDSLKKHFKVRTGSGVLGVHGASADQTSRWMAVDIDRHDEDDLSVTREANFAAAQHWWRMLKEHGFDALWLDSNGIGGFHLMVLFAEPLAAGQVHEYGRSLVADFVKRGLSQPPEVFPGEPCWDHYGSWLRLPGRHHSRAHYTRVWSDEPWTDRPWLEGHDAIDRLLATVPAEVALAGQHGILPARRTVCLDFDGVIHSYHSGWCGADVIPDPPLHGAREAIARLRKSFRVVVHSARCHTLAGRNAVTHWLTKHGIEVDEVCEHKPAAVVYVDDRAVPFRGDWDQVLIAIQQFRR